MRVTAPALFALGILCGLTGVPASDRQASPAPQASTSSVCLEPKEYEAMMRELTSLRERVEQLERLAESREGLQALGLAMVRSEGPAPGGTISLKSRFAQEVEDPVAARAREASILEALKALDSQEFLVKEVACRSSICRLELVFGQEFARQQLLPELFMSLAWLDEASVESDPKAPIEVTIYLAAQPVRGQPSSRATP